MSMVWRTPDESSCCFVNLIIDGCLAVNREGWGWRPQHLSVRLTAPNLTATTGYETATGIHIPGVEKAVLLADAGTLDRVDAEVRKHFPIYMKTAEGISLLTCPEGNPRPPEHVPVRWHPSSNWNGAYLVSGEELYVGGYGGWTADCLEVDFTPPRLVVGDDEYPVETQVLLAPGVRRGVLLDKQEYQAWLDHAVVAHFPVYVKTEDGVELVSSP
jgi:hypothetical protein